MRRDLVMVTAKRTGACRACRLFALFSVAVATVLIAPPTQAAPGACVPPPTLVEPIQFVDKCPEDPGGPAAVVARGRDVYVQLPVDRACGNRLTITQARNVRITGGVFVLKEDSPAVVNLGTSSGTTFVDGMLIDVNGKPADAIRTYRHTGRLIVQNVRIQGVSGVQSGPHGDVVHAQGGGPLRELVLQNVSGFTGYQGLFAPYRAASGHGARKVRLIRVNLAYEPWRTSVNPLKLFFFGDQGNPVDRPPDRGTTLNAVYADGSAQGVAFDRTIYTRPVADETGCATFDPVHGIVGKICGGPPPGGDFAPAALVGTNYRRESFCR